MVNQIVYSLDVLQFNKKNAMMLAMQHKDAVDCVNTDIIVFYVGT